MDSRKFKIIIVDNEEETRNTLVTMLEKHDDIIIAAQAHNVSTALKKIVEIKPDLIFLAVALPKKDGFSMVDALKKINCNDIAVVFLTEGCEHAQKAILNCAFDYLSKPLKADELDKTLLKFRVKHSAEPKSKAAPTGELIPSPHKKVSVLTPTGHLFINPEDIAYIRCKRKHTFMTNSENKVQEACVGLKILVAAFNDINFVIVHKSYAINRRYLHAVFFLNKSCTLKIGDELVDIPLSCRGKKKLK